MTQLSLLGKSKSHRLGKRTRLPKNHRQAALAFLEKYPKFWSYVKQFALERSQQGRRFGIKAVTERARWDYTLYFLPSDEEFMLNNSYPAYWARQLLKELPMVEPYLELRKVKY